MGVLATIKRFARPVALGVGAGIVTQQALSRVGINIPFVGEIGAFVLGGPVGLGGKIAFDVITTGTSPILGGLGVFGGGGAVAGAGTAGIDTS